MTLSSRFCVSQRPDAWITEKGRACHGGIQTGYSTGTGNISEIRCCLCQWSGRQADFRRKESNMGCDRFPRWWVVLSLFPYASSGCLSYTISALFPFKYPTNSATLNFGGIATYICTWSGLVAPSINSTPFISHNFLKISPTSLRTFPNNIFFRYLG